MTYGAHTERACRSVPRSIERHEVKQLTLIDTFSGIGGFSLAGRWAGYRTVCFSEVDPYASDVLRKHWPDVPNLGDIKNADFTPYAGATVLTGGFPCQPFSVAGKRKGRQDDRFLWPALLEAIQDARPTWVVGENVTGIVGMELDRVLSDLAGLGYSGVPFVIPACAVDAKHRRARVWIVANCSGQRCRESEEGTIQQPRGAEAVGPGEVVANASLEHRPKHGRQTPQLMRSSQAVAHSNSPREQQQTGDISEGRDRLDDRSQAMANAMRDRTREEPEALQDKGSSTEVREGRRPRSKPSHRSQTLSDTQGPGLPHGGQPGFPAGSPEEVWQIAFPRFERRGGAQWPAEPNVGRVAHGVSRMVDRIKSLGNAIVPQVAFQILQAIAKVEAP